MVTCTCLSLASMQVWLLWGSIVGPLLVWAQRGRHPGLPRLLTAAPVIAANLAIPRLFDGYSEVLTCFTVAVATAFLSNLKASWQWQGCGRRTWGARMQRWPTLPACPSHPQLSLASVQ